MALVGAYIALQDLHLQLKLPFEFQCLLKEFPKLCSEKKELFVLKCWCCIVPILGEVCNLYVKNISNDIFSLGSRKNAILTAKDSEGDITAFTT